MMSQELSFKINHVKPGACHGAAGMLPARQGPKSAMVNGKPEVMS